MLLVSFSDLALGSKVVLVAGFFDGFLLEERERREEKKRKERDEATVQMEATVAFVATKNCWKPRYGYKLQASYQSPCLGRNQLEGQYKGLCVR